MRLRVDLHGDGTLSTPCSTHDQDRAIAFGYTGNRSLNLCLNGGEGFLTVVLRLDACTGCQ